MDAGDPVADVAEVGGGGEGRGDHAQRQRVAATATLRLDPAAPWASGLDPALLVDDEIVLPVQINGKKRADLRVAKDSPIEEIEAVVLALDVVLDALAGASPRRVVVVPGRIVNVVL